MMSTHRIAGYDIDGCTIDVLYKLYFRGAQESGDLPSKGGMASLISLGWAQTDWAQPKPHSLTPPGKIIAQLYYQAKAERAAAVLDTAELTQGALTAAVEAGDIRWMARGKPDIREWVPADTMYTLAEIKHDLGFSTKIYRGQHPVDRDIITLTFTVAPSGTDCRTNIIGEDV
jgi:hypothetical protein